tara:strand:- start:309 stop:878 length:570 start_codon:yes stop_codon:yes gene_type:complete
MDNVIDRIFRRAIYVNYFILNTIIHFYIFYFLPNIRLSNYFYTLSIFFYFLNIFIFIIASFDNQVIFLNQTIVLILVHLFNFIKGVINVLFELNKNYFFEIETQISIFFLINLFLITNFIYSLFSNTDYFKDYFQQIPGKFYLSNNSCSICLENNSDWLLDCKHHFHKKCLKKWYKLNKTCPYCRKSLI